MAVRTGEGNDGKRALEGWLATAGLYKARIFSANELSELAALLREGYPAFGFDAYCVPCRSISHFKWTPSGRIRHQIPPSLVGRRGSSPGETAIDYHAELLPTALSQAVFLCARDGSHRMPIFLHFTVDHAKEQISFTKIGQYPSSFDLVSAELERFSKLLEPQDLREMRSAEICAAAGLHIAGFTYLRRVFERRLEIAHRFAKQSAGWDEAGYQANIHRMDERIKALREYLPRFLVEHRLAYKILSLGIHQLTEEECADGYVALNEGVRLMLEEEIAKRDHEAAVTRAGDSIRRLGNRYKDDR
jgi:hypothetical protein